MTEYFQRMAVLALAESDDADGWRVELREIGGGASGCTPLIPETVARGLTVGDEADVAFTHAFGEYVGLIVDGETLHWRDELTRVADHALRVARDKTRRIETFINEERSKIEEDYRSLPEVFRRRIDRFVATKGPSWWWEYGAYEMICCVDGVKIAKAMAADLGLEPGLGIDSDDLQDKIEAWLEAGNADQVDGLSDGHSGNSFLFACRLAWHWLVAPHLVEMEHGALTPLVGCDEYGCPHDKDRGEST